jgi:hypothetical protein
LTCIYEIRATTPDYKHSYPKSNFTIPGGAEDSPLRIWKSKAGSEIVAALVNWSDYDVTLRTEDGRELEVALDQISGTDLSYLQGEMSLEVEKKPEVLPWVDVGAVVKSRSKDTSYNIYGTRFDARAIKMVVDIDNHSDEKLDPDVIWMYFAEGVSSRIKIKTAEDLYPFNVETAQITLEPRSDTTFETEEARKTAVGYGQSYKGGSKIKGFVVQVYWKDWLLKGFASHHMLSDAAEDPDLMKSIRSSRE